MTDKTKNKLMAAWAWCDEEDKSTEFMLQFMADEGGVEYMRVVDFLQEIGDEERTKWYEDNPNWLKDWHNSHILCPECGDALLEPVADYNAFSCPACKEEFTKEE